MRVLLGAMTVLLLCACASGGGRGLAAHAPSDAYCAPLTRRASGTHWRDWEQAANSARSRDPWLDGIARSGARCESGTDAPRPFLNGLILQRTPYLLQHAFDPIDWRGAEDPTARPAHAEGSKETSALRFVSIGYSSCHWCHVMAEQSFRDPAIAETLNRSYTSIKIDREQHPELDALYARRQRSALGSMGWPITAVENAKGELLYIGAYLPPDRLQALLSRFERMARTAPASLEALAASHAALDAADESQPSSTRPPIDLEAVLAADWDHRHGGLSGAQKFPEPALLRWLLQSADPAAENPAARALASQLDGMLAGGLFDPLQGGFFRYATASDWSRPHFEKMLYTQALLIEAYARAGVGFGRSDWLQVALDSQRFVDATLLDAESGLYRSAVDARHDGTEGGLYLISTDTAARLAARSGLDSYRFDEGQALLRMGHLQPRAEAVRAALAALRANAPPPAPAFVDSKTLTAWNALQARALLALAAAGEKRFAERADAVLDRLWLRFDPDSGRLARAADGSGDAALEDYAQLALALLASADNHWRKSSGAGEADSRRQAAMRERQALQLASAAMQRYLPLEASTDTRWIALAEDGELPSPAAALCELSQDLLQRAHDDALERQTRACLEALAQARRDAGGTYWSSAALDDVPSARPRAVHHLAEGRIRATLSPRADGVRLNIAPGWHVQANPVSDLRLKPTALRSPGDGSPLDTRYPPARRLHTEWQDLALDVYTGTVELRLAEPAACMALELQACSDQVCLLPERALLREW
jgi:uncharacterized protein YyaL (SSP411 family)